jgi:hypothetical protein
MKKTIIGAAVFAAALAALHRFAPAIHQAAMNKCRQMISKCGEMLGQQAGTPAGAACVSATAPGPEQAAAGEPEPAEATQAS